MFSSMVDAIGLAFSSKLYTLAWNVHNLRVWHGTIRCLQFAPHDGGRQTSSLLSPATSPHSVFYQRLRFCGTAIHGAGPLPAPYQNP